MKTIVIVGGGYGGITLAKVLDKQQGVRILLIDAKSHFYHTVGGLRGAVQDLDDSLFIPYSNLFTCSHHQVVHATVNRFDENAVFLNADIPEWGDRIPFDFLVIASGTNYPAPARINATELDQGKQQLQHIRQQVLQAQHILIVGGGPVGIEFAGELQQQQQQGQKVTLIHGQSQLGHPSYMPLKVHSKLMGLMTSSGVNVLLNDKVKDLPQNDNNSMVMPVQGLTTSEQGKDLSTVDLVVLATGNRPDPSWVKQSFPELVQDDGYIKVKSTFQVDHATLADRVFVMGDAAALDETKLAYRAANGHVPVVAANLMTLVQRPDTPEHSLKHYKKGIDVMLITFGKSNGVTILPWGFTLGGWFSSLLKSKTLFFDRYWKELNQPVPRLL
ncbi:hypothetical protein BC941DRAFT_423004 [Chlamydoabsidia padenii]|nr:hypothetical protein BC941DRAFT_423004 [Chlamydoabsidia padenii]